jgi:hypothetical protein
MDCAFSVTAPAISVFLIAVGLTLPALLWPISELRRRRWESRSFDTLGWLWHELTTAAPDVIFATSTGGDESDFLLHRRVIEINDGILALRPYRSLQVQQAAEHALAARQHRNPTDRDAMVEAAVLADAVRSARHGWSPSSQEAPPAPGTTSREGKLQAETEWLLKVARAYPRSGAVRATARKQDLSGSP